MLKLSINGKSHQVDVEPEMPLLWVLRDQLGMTGTKFGCGIAQCGACTVHVNGEPMRSCSYPVSAAVGSQVMTIEGLSKDGTHPVQMAWKALDVPQCGYCQPGMMMACTASIKAGNHGSGIASDLKHICICGTYPRIRNAITGL